MKKTPAVLLAGLLFGLVFVRRLAAQANPESSTEQDSLANGEAYPAHFWVAERIAPPIYDGWATGDNSAYGSPMMAIDGADRLHLTYNGGQQYYTSQTEDGWTTTTTSIFGAVTSFTADSSGNLHLIYYDYSIGNLVYSHRANNQWNTQVITTSFSTPAHLVLDQEQNPHVAFYDTSEGRLAYAYRNGNDWVVETVSTNAGAKWQRFLTLQIDNQGQPHLIYPSLDSHDLIYTRRQNSQWITETLANDVTSAWLTLDSLGNPHIVFFTTANQSYLLRYTHWTGLRWASETIEANMLFYDPNQYDYLVLDSQDRPHFVYRTSGSHPHLRYAYKNDQGQWLISDANLFEQESAALVLNSQDIPFILHLDTLYRHVWLTKFATSITYSPLIVKP